MSGCGAISWLSTFENTSPRGADVIDQVIDQAVSWRYLSQYAWAPDGPTSVQLSSGATPWLRASSISTAEAGSYAIRIVSHSSCAPTGRAAPAPVAFRLWVSAGSRDASSRAMSSSLRRLPPRSTPLNVRATLAFTIAEPSG